ncbi:putative molybdenum cofactor synthesis protein [Rosellinia necatrix]|uniref:Adenylyltransferase and sulfurtransferase uba4 n=1 Tax=Rosellinia necatrix TaxID=77044 RepID=A0A1W2TPT4_ROSNE|nr:putative molybdenum cofactor synthesis protein [Rosellinia necatrix]
MDVIADRIEQLRTQISRAEDELLKLKTQLAELEASAQPPSPESQQQGGHPTATRPGEWKWPLKEEEYARYGRQLVLPAVGIGGQLRLRSAAVLIVGAGGLGCPAAAYLAGAGVGTLGFADGDTVEVSNLHRQIAHGTARVGASKVDSLAAYCRGLNPGVRYVGHGAHLTPQNAEDVVRPYDVVLDCTDHPTSRYLISDVCVLLGKPLVSASALRTDGQLIVLNNPPVPRGSAAAATAGGPCYRCVFPRPPPVDSVVSCGEGGILGPVVGVMGVLQALETIKLIVAGLGGTETDPAATLEQAVPPSPSLLLFSATSSTPFRSLRMRGRRANCFACSATSTLTPEYLRSGSLDYVQFCGVAAPVNILQPDERISAADYNSLLVNGAAEKSLLLDVREKEHFDVANIPGAVNVPYPLFQSKSRPMADGADPLLKWLSHNESSDAPIYVVCRLGNDSQLVAKKLKEMGLDRCGKRFIGDIKGGMMAWKRDIDRTMPVT